MAEKWGHEYYLLPQLSYSKRRNYISKLERDDGSGIEKEHLIGEELVNYFTKLFTLAQLTNFEPILQGIEKKVTPSMNSNLTLEFIADC